ncbi:BolA family protein [Synechococcus sp. OH20]|uniref:BolA family protein n=1 Tax=unclassified Synechococcus TaxID=2626047 RepID=UPI0039C5DC6C
MDEQVEIRNGILSSGTHLNRPWGQQRMDPREIEALLQAALPGARVQVEDTVGDGSHFQAIVVAEQFQGLPLIKQHRLVNEALKTYLQDGRLHALALRTFTPAQWEQFRGLG